MKSLNYSSITAALRRIHRAKAKSDATGIPVTELLEQDRELRRKLARERDEQRQRRDFLRTAGGALGAGLLASTRPALANNGGGNDNQPDIAIIGAGAGGLRTAHRLQQYGIPSTVYEAGDRVGGRMYSDRSFFSDGRVVEYGGEFISTEHTAIRNLAHQLGLQLEDVNKLSLGDEETYRIVDSYGVPRLYTEADLMDEWVGGLYETMKRAQMDAPWQPFYNAFNPEHERLDNLDAIEWMESPEVGYSRDHWVHKLLLADLVAEYGITVGNSALNLIYLLAWNGRGSGGLPLAGTDERLHVVGGNDLIPRRMADALPNGSIEFGKKLVAIHGDNYRQPFSLDFEDGSSITCDVLVLALPMNLIDDIEIDSAIEGTFNPKKLDAFAAAPVANVSDNGKVMCETGSRIWDMVQTINGQQVHQAARAYSFAGEAKGAYSGFISTWEGEPGNPSPLGVIVNYNGGFEARNLASTEIHGPADPADVERFLTQADQIWPGIRDDFYGSTGKALVSNWIGDPLARSAFTSPAVGTMTGWWGAQWETENRIYFAGEAYDEEYWSYMNGAVLSGERVAREIHQNY